MLLDEIVLHNVAVFCRLQPGGVQWFTAGPMPPLRIGTEIYVSGELLRVEDIIYDDRGRILHVACRPVNPAVGDHGA